MISSSIVLIYLEFYDASLYVLGTIASSTISTLAYLEFGILIFVDLLSCNLSCDTSTSLGITYSIFH